LKRTGDAGCDPLLETLRERKLVKYQGLPSHKRIFIMLSSTAQNSQLSLPSVTWEQFELVEAAFAGIGGVRFIYLDGVLEIMGCLFY
jgi:hypothetical protein